MAKRFLNCLNALKCLNSNQNAKLFLIPFLRSSCYELLINIWRGLDCALFTYKACRKRTEHAGREGRNTRRCPSVRFLLPYVCKRLLVRVRKAHARGLRLVFQFLEDVHEFVSNFKGAGRLNRCME